MQRIVAALVVAGCVLVSPLARAGQEEAKETPPQKTTDSETDSEDTARA